MYFTVPNRMWAIDAKTGEKIWEFRRPAEGDDLGQRGVAFYKGRVYFGTTDAHFFCLDARNGKQIWETTVADVKFGYYLSVAPLIVKGLVVLGTSGDSANVPHFVEALDWDTGKIVWQTSTVPKPGTPEAGTWPNDYAMRHGGGPAWFTGTYDPELNLIYWGTGNPHPVLAGAGTFRRLPMTRMIGMRWKLPFYSMRRSTENHASCWRRQAAMGTSLCSTA